MFALGGSVSCSGLSRSEVVASRGQPLSSFTPLTFPSVLRFPYPRDVRQTWLLLTRYAQTVCLYSLPVSPQLHRRLQATHIHADAVTGRVVANASIRHTAWMRCVSTVRHMANSVSKAHQKAGTMQGARLGCNRSIRLHSTPRTRMQLQQPQGTPNQTCHPLH